MKDITFLNIIHKVKISFSPPFSSRITDLAENVMPATGDSLPVFFGPLQETYCLFLWPTIFFDKENLLIMKMLKIGCSI